MSINSMEVSSKYTALNKVKVVIRRIENVMLIFCCIVLFALMVLNTCDVVGRVVLNKPILGTSEISAIMMVAVIVLGWAYTQREGGHIRAEFVVQKFHPRVQEILKFITLLLSLVLFIIITKQSWNISMGALGDAGRHFQLINIPKGPFLLMVPVGGFFICLELIMQLIDISLGMKKPG